jgi:hypothetical protein
MIFSLHHRLVCAEFGNWSLGLGLLTRFSENKINKIDEKKDDRITMKKACSEVHFLASWLGVRAYNYGGREKVLKRELSRLT